MHRDQYGIIGQVQSDGSIEGGDSACWHGHLLLMRDGTDGRGSAVTDSKSFEKFFSLGWGAYVRHPVPSSTNFGFGAYYKNPWAGCISRDQLTGILCGLFAGGNVAGVLRLMLHQMCSLMLFAYNTIDNGSRPEDRSWHVPDLLFIDTWVLMLRGLRWVTLPLYPLLCVLDLYLVIQVIWTEFEEDTDIINHTGRMIVAATWLPTPFVWLAWRLTTQKKWFDKLKAYWSGWRQQPEMCFFTIQKIEQINRSMRIPSASR